VPQVGEAEEDLEHFLLVCPATAAIKYDIFGEQSPPLSALSEREGEMVLCLNRLSPFCNY